MTLNAFPIPDPNLACRQPHRPSRALRAAALAVLLLGAASGAAHGQNLLDNGDFDTDVDGWSALSGFITHDDTEGSTSGPGALSIFGQGGQSSAAQCVRDILASTTYTFGADFRIDDSPSGRLNFCRVRVDGYDASSCTGPSDPEMGSVQETLASVSATYTSLASSFVTGPSTAAVSFRLDCDRDFGNHTVKWDDAFLVAEEAEATRYTLLAGFGDVLYHLPGDDGLLGNGDDVMLADPTTVVGSDPNYRGAYSYRAGKIAATLGEPGLPDGFNRIAFLEGTVDVVPGGILVGSDLLRTGRRQGMGLRPWDGPVDDDYLAGDVMTLQAPFLATGNSYVDGVLIPKANQLGATGLLFVDIAGLRPPNSNHPSGLPIRVVMAGVTGVPGMPAPAAPTAKIIPAVGADLAVTKTADVSGLQAPGTFVDYTLTVGNAGPEIADGVVLRDRIPFETAYVGNDCGAPAPDPTNRIFPWDVGQLAAGGNADCKVTVQVLGEANFDFHNAAIAFGDSWDPNLADNVSERRVDVLDAAPPGVEQVPDRLSGFPSDLDCDACNSGVQAIADSFKLDAPVEICGVSFSGGYTDDLPFVDQFLIAIYDDNRVTPGIAGVPGDPVATLTAIPRRFATGERIDDRFDEYRYFVPLLPGIGPVLDRGRYWLVIVNDSSASAGTGDWFWESAAADAFGRSVPGIAFNPGFDNPSPGWGVSNRQTEAAFLLVLCLTPPDMGAIFADGFESGDTSRWSVTVP